MSDGPTSGIWTEPLTIRSYDVDFKHLATLEALCRYFLEAAWSHAEALGAGFKHLARHNKVWVLSRLLVTMERYPRWTESVVLKTWPRPSDSIFALRDFELVDSAGGRLGGGASAWLVLDATSRRPQRIEKLLDTIQTVNQRATERDPAKLQEHKAASAGKDPAAYTRTARYGDIDLNGHVNSARYIGWLLDSYSLDWHQSHLPASLEINYLGEARANEVISTATVQIATNEFFHSLLAGSREACRARLTWTNLAHQD